MAELFRDCFAEAKPHRERARASNRRLKWTVWFALAAFVGLVCSLATIALFPPQQTGPTLADKARVCRSRTTRPAVRLAEGEIEKNKHTLRGFTTDSGYPSLEGDLQTFVESRLKEIEDYESYRGKLADALAPAAVRNLPDLAKACLLDGELALPRQYAWQETAAAKLHDKWVADARD